MQNTKDVAVDSKTCEDFKNFDLKYYFWLSENEKNLNLITHNHSGHRMFKH